MSRQDSSEGIDIGALTAALRERPMHYAAQPIRRLSRGKWVPAHSEWLVRPEEHWGITTSDLIDGTVSLGVQPLLDRRVMGDAIEFLSRNPGQSLAVNTMAASFADAGCVSYLLDQLDRYGIEPGRVLLEITEHEPFGDFKQAATQINRLRTVGIRVGLDDVGTGCFTLTTALNMSFVDYAKFDRSMIQSAVQDRDSLERLKLLLKAARRRHLDTIIEGVETRAHLALATELGARMAQGFYWDLPEQVFEAQPEVRSLPTRTRRAAQAI